MTETSHVPPGAEAIQTRDQETQPESDYNTGQSGPKLLLRWLSLAAFGIVIFSDPFDRFNLFNLAFGILICLLLGGLLRMFLKGLIALFNPSLRRERGKKAIRAAIDNGMMFLTPFAVMALMATFLLNWTMTGILLSTGIMASGTAAAIEVGKLKGQQAIKNTLITSGVCFAFSLAVKLTLKYMAMVPGLMSTLSGFLLGTLKGGGF